MRLLDFINEKTNNAYKDFKLVSVIFDEKLKVITFKFLYKESIHDDDKNILNKLIREYIKEDIEVVVKCKKAYVDNELVLDVIYNFIVRNFNSIGVDFLKDNIKVNISDDNIYVNIECTPFQHNYIINNSIDSEIISYANSFFFEPFILNIDKVESRDVLLEDLQPINIDLTDHSENNFKYHKINNLISFIGEVGGNAIQIKSIKGILQDIEIAGTLKFLTEKSFESKRKDKEGNTITKTYYSFSIIDKTGRMNCVYFPTKSDLIKFQSLQEDCVVLVHGDIEEFNGRVNFKVKSKSCSN